MFPLTGASHFGAGFLSHSHIRTEKLTPRALIGGHPLRGGHILACRLLKGKASKYQRAARCSDCASANLLKFLGRKINFPGTKMATKPHGGNEFEERISAPKPEKSGFDPNQFPGFCL